MIEAIEIISRLQNQVNAKKIELAQHKSTIFEKDQQIIEFNQ